MAQVPYDGKVLEGEALRKQLNKWADYGTIEPTARDAISYLIDNPKQLDLSDKVSQRSGRGQRRNKAGSGVSPTLSHKPPRHTYSTSCCWARGRPWARC